ncbi:MAG: transporter substrate-binding domain-containing protein, partial [Candidatus Cloacimonetes bacterium]|nr:transporter substrate-binding domain-containing protein [Candidatus Cloacimonadota bacterium]
EHIRIHKIPGFMHSYTSVNYISSHAGNEDLKVLPVPENIYSLQYGAISHNIDIIESFDAYMSSIEDSGLYKNIWDIWFDITRDSEAPLPEFTSSGSKGSLKVAICTDTAPFVYVGNDGIYKGFCIDLLKSYAAHIDKSVQYLDVDTKELIPYVENKKADFGISNIPIIEYPGRKILYSKPIYEDKQGILILRSEQENPQNMSAQDNKGV